MTTIRQIYGQLTDSQMSDEDVRSEIDQVQREGQDLAASLTQYAGYLNDGGKEMVVKAAFLVAAADGEVQDEERELLATVGDSLGMSAPHLKGVISAMREE